MSPDSCASRSAPRHALHIAGRWLCVVSLVVAAQFVAVAAGADDMQASMPPAGAPGMTETQPGAPSDAQAGPGYRLGAGDRVRIVVFGQPDLSGEFHLDGAGQISMPLIKTVDAEGLGASELERRIAEKLSPGYLKDPRVSVEILSYRPFYIVGEVNAPGSYPYVSGMTAINAVALAGGFTYRANESSFEIRRGEEGSAQELDATPDTVVEPGDVIRIKERWF